MLVLRLVKGQDALVFEDGTRLYLLGIEGQRVKIGIEGPGRVHREEAPDYIRKRVEQPSEGVLPERSGLRQPRTDTGGSNAPQKEGTDGKQRSLFNRNRKPGTRP